MKYSRREKYSKPRTPADALILALEREKASCHFYNHIVKKRMSPVLTKLFRQLRDEEAGHIKKIELMLKA